MKITLQAPPFLAALCLCCCMASAQEQNLDALYTATDLQAGRKNLALYNGTLHFDQFRVDNKSFRYYAKDYGKGSLEYAGQYYPEAFLKYDLYQDILIAKAEGEGNRMGINLIGAKVAWFTLDGKTFVNLTGSQNNLDTQGFYEKDRFGATVTLYTKHRKERTETLHADGAYSQYQASEAFVLEREGKWFALKGENSVITAFPEQADAIRKFYNANTAARSNDPKSFMKALLQHLDFNRKNNP